MQQTNRKFNQLPDLDLQATVSNPETPCILRGIATSWPAIRKWSFTYLSELAPALPISLVVGNRELHGTRFVDSTLGEYLRGLEHADLNADPLYLKEFDFLKKFPQLKEDLRSEDIFPRKAIVGSSVWIGPAKARTGLHYDFLHNIAMLIGGHKRFYLASPGTVECIGEVSKKYDRWARLSRVGIDDLANRDAIDGRLYEVDLFPGDALYIPAGWWHEVVNIQPSILLSGFFNKKFRVASLWMYTGVQQYLHNAAFWRDRNCTCHKQRGNHAVPEN